jgi:putative adenylate-forming enzyme
MGNGPVPPMWDLVRRAFDGWSRGARLSEIVWTRQRGAAAIDAARRARFASLVRHARAHSPFYREAYRGIGDGDVAPTDLPVVDKSELMRHFDDWVTDRAVTRAGVDDFLADRTRIGERYLGRYTLWKSSGSSGLPGIFVQDDAALGTYDALLAAEVATTRVAVDCARGTFAKGARAALIVATGDHYASIASWQQGSRGVPWASARSFSILDPLSKLVAALNAWDPAFVASYPTMLALLADERDAGRLAIAPALVWSGGEHLSTAARLRLEHAFGCPVINEYGASECMCIAFGCREGALHVNADWVLLEPVDRRYRPTPPGECSETVLVTNLANRVQPVIRYDLGDSIVVRPEPCRCGSSLPAIEVTGRRDDVLLFADGAGRTIRLLPLALETVVEQATAAHPVQIVRGAADRLRLRLPPMALPERRAAWTSVATALRAWLDRQGLANVEVELDPEGAGVDPASGKLRRVVAAEPAGRRRDRQEPST